MVQNLPAVQETRFDPWEKGMATHSSILAWRIPCTEEPGGLQSMSAKRAGHNWVTNNFTFLDFKPHDRKFTIYHFLNSTSKGKIKPTDFLTSVCADIGNLRHHKNLLEYSWPLKNMGLNFKGLLKCRFFSMVKTTVLFNLQLLTSSTHHCKHEGTLDKKCPL